jgi:hypothetical protein
VLSRHLVRNACLPMITLIGLSIPALLAGNLIAGYVFSYDGLGLLFFSGLSNEDYPVLIAGHAGGPIVATSSVTVAATSASAPRTSPVMPPSRRTACRCTMKPAPRPAMTESGSVQPSGSPTTVAETTTAAAAAASVASVAATATGGRTDPATSAPSPSGRAAGTP